MGSENLRNKDFVVGLHKNDKCEIVMADKTSPPPPPPPKIAKSCNECNMWHLLAFTIHWAVKNRTNEPEEPILQGNSRRCTADRERIHTGERSHRKRCLQRQCEFKKPRRWVEHSWIHIEQPGRGSLGGTTKSYREFITHLDKARQPGCTRQFFSRQRDKCSKIFFISFRNTKQ